MQINDTFSYLGDDVMIKLLSKHNRWRDVIDIRNTEVKLSVIFTIVLTIAAFCFSIYENFYLISEQVQNLLLEILSAMIGFIWIVRGKEKVQRFHRDCIKRRSHYHWTIFSKRN